MESVTNGKEKTIIKDIVGYAKFLTKSKTATVSNSGEGRFLSIEEIAQTVNLRRKFVSNLIGIKYEVDSTTRPKIGSNSDDYEADDESSNEEMMFIYDGVQTWFTIRCLENKQKNQPKKKLRRPAYSVWAAEMRQNLATSDVSFGALEVKMHLHKFWSVMPVSEKCLWKKRAKEITEESRNGAKENAPCKKPRVENDVKTMSGEVPKVLPDPSKNSIRFSMTTPVFKDPNANRNIAPYLRVLGRAVTNIGKRLSAEQNQKVVSESSELLHDSVLCCIGSLMYLTRLSFEKKILPEQDMAKILDNISSMVDL